MAGEIIAFLRLLRLFPAIIATITSPEFLALKIARTLCVLLQKDDLWHLLFIVCRALYAPMRVLRLADTKTPGMDKLYYYLRCTDEMLKKFLPQLNDLTKTVFTESMKEFLKEAKKSDGDEEEDEVSSSDDEDDVTDADPSSLPFSELV